MTHHATMHKEIGHLNAETFLRGGAWQWGSREAMALVDAEGGVQAESNAAVAAIERTRHRRRVVWRLWIPGDPEKPGVYDLRSGDLEPRLNSGWRATTPDGLSMDEDDMPTALRWLLKKATERGVVVRNPEVTP